MKELRYQVSYQTSKIRVKRLQSKFVKIRFLNISNENWISSSNKQAEHKVVPNYIDKAPHPDFTFMAGKLEDRSDRRMSKIIHNHKSADSADESTAHPGDEAEFFIRITPKKYATRGRHELSFVPIVHKNPDVPSEVLEDNMTTMVTVVPERHRWLHLKRTIKLMMSKPGKISREENNDALDSVDDKDFKKFIPVIMATWQRVDKLEASIESLATQKGSKAILYIWNNNPQIADAIDNIANKSSLPIKIVHSAYNIGGYGRFYMAKRLVDQFDKALFIDDDQVLEKNTLSGFAKEYEPKKLKGFWAYRFQDPDNYWHKEKLEANQKADYIGTGGLLADLSIFKEPRVFECPKKYWFVEDVWLSFVATHYLGWPATRSKTGLKIEDDGKDQASKLIDIKTDMLVYLLENGWKTGITEK